VDETLFIFSDSDGGCDKVFRIGNDASTSEKGLDSSKHVSRAMAMFVTAGHGDVDQLLMPEEPEQLIYIPGTWEILFGLTLASSGIHLFRAVCQGLAFFYYDLLINHEIHTPARALYVCDGAFNHKKFCQIFAHVYDIPVTILRTGSDRTLMPYLERETVPSSFSEVLLSTFGATLQPESALHTRYMQLHKQYSSLKRDTILYNKG